MKRSTVGIVTRVTQEEMVANEWPIRKLNAVKCGLHCLILTHIQSTNSDGNLKRV